jgi:murein DD-endopeptidase MepM/ murein hydrolase activator NlpD
MYRVSLLVLSFGALCLCACDLQPKIVSIPDNIGLFIEDRYPTLLADPQNQPEIYNSAVTDYGVYASPELYGSSKMEDYVLYASVDDYVLVPKVDVINVEKHDDETKVETKIEEETEQEFEDLEIMSEYLVVPVYGGNTVIDEIAEEEPVKVEETKPAEPKVEEIAKSEVKPETPNVEKNGDEIIVKKGDTLYALARENNTTVSELAKINNLKEPYTLSIGQKLSLRQSVVEKPKSEKPKAEVKKEEVKKVEKPIPNVISEEKIKQIKEEKAKNIVSKETVKPTSTKRVDLQEITVAKGDTLYSLSRKYEIPVNDLAIMNKLSAPFTLSVGQKLKVPKLAGVQTRSAVTVKKTTKVATPATTSSKTPTTTQTKKTTVSTQKSEKPSYTKVESKPKTTTKTTETKKTTTKIAPRSSSKFSWPVRGKILSGYGPKNGGLVNDGINISAPLGTVVRAAENGVVAYAGNEVKGMGNLIIIQHSDGWMTVYAHLNSMDVRRGARVNVGQPIGKIGKTGKVDKPQLHFEIRKGTKSYNPTNYLKK